MNSPAAPYLQELPSTWRTTRAKHVFIERELRSTDGSEELFSLSKVRGLLPRSEVTDKEARADSLEGYKRFLSGDLVMNKMQAWNGVFGFSGSQEGLVSPDYSVFSVVENVDARFFTYLFKTDLYAGVFEQLARGMGTAFLRLNTDDFGSVDVPLPAAVEQVRIANFLDEKTARIDALIAEKQKLSSLLDEHISATAGKLIFGDLSSEGMLAGSFQYLGRLPDSWSSPSVSMLFEISRGRVMSNEEIELNPGPYPVYSSQTESDGVMGHIDTYMFEGDYLTWTTDGAKAGTVFRRNGRFNCTNVCGALKPRANVNMDFVREALSLITPYYVRQDINPKLMSNVMAKIRLPLPPPLIQKTLAFQIIEIRVRSNILKNHIQEHIYRLREYRSSLISAAVTGQISIP